MSKIGLSAAALTLAVALYPLSAMAQDAGAPARDWPTWGYDGARTGWNRSETSLTPKNVSRLALFLPDGLVGAGSKLFRSKLVRSMGRLRQPSRPPT